MKTQLRLLTSAASFIAISTQAQAQELSTSARATQTQDFIVIGDSISAGFLGFTQLAPKPQSSQMMTTQATDGYEEPPPPKAWKGIRYPAVAESKSEWSWATGDETDSIAHRLLRWLNPAGSQTATRVRWINLAESGALTSHIPRQVRLAFEKRESDKNRPIALVSLMIGANDACDSLSTTPEEAAQLASNMRVTFRRLAASRPDSMKYQPLRVFVSSIPNIPALGSPDILNHRAYLGMTCEGVRKNVVNMCPLLIEWKTPEEYQARVNRVHFINDVLKKSVEQAKKEFPQLSLHFDNSFFEYPLDGSLLGFDCFHPGKRGQTELARILWQGMPWFSTVNTPK